MLIPQAVVQGAGATAPGYELDYAQQTADTTISGATQGTANTIVDGNSVSYDGNTVVLIELVASAVQPGATAGDRVTFVIYQDGSALTDVALFQAQTTQLTPGYGARRLTPSAGAHTYSFRAYRTGTSNGTVFASSGAGGRSPAFIRITRV